MATSQLHPAPPPQDSYRSPYSFVSTYDKWSTLNQERMKVLDKPRGDETTHLTPTSSHQLVDAEQTIIDVASDAENGFLDIHELLLDVQQKDITTSGTAGKMDIGVGSGSSAAFSRSTKGSTQNLLNPSVESEADHKILEVDLTDSDPSHNADSDGTVTHQTSRVRVDSEITQGSASYNDLDVIKEAEGERVDVLADNKDDADTCSTERLGSSIVSTDNPAPDSTVSISEPQGSQLDSAQSPHPSPAALSHHQSDLTNNLVPRSRRRRDNTKNVTRKRLRTPVLTEPTSTASTVPVALESNDSERAQSAALLVAPAKEREIRDINHEMVDDRGTDDSNDEVYKDDYDDVSDTAASEIQRPPHSRKRVKRAKVMEENDVDSPSTDPLNVSYQGTAATLSGGMQESEELPIHGYLTLKTIHSKVVYCLTFSQDFSAEPGGTPLIQEIPRSVSNSRVRRDSERLPLQEQAMGRPVRNSRFSSQDDELLLRLRGEGLSWDEISDRFPERSKGTLQVHYSTKLKPRPETSKDKRKRRRSG